MASMLSASISGVSYITKEPYVGRSSRRSELFTQNYCASISASYVPTLLHKTGKTQKEFFSIISSRHNLDHHYKVIDEGSTCQKRETKYVVKAISSGQSFEYEYEAKDPKSIWVTIKNAFDAFYRFTRPYAAIEAAMAVASLSFLAVEKLSDLSPLFFIALFKLLVASFFMNIFHCGFNQLCDIEIDKINKPYLPLASGEWSYTKSVIIVASSLLLCFGLAWIEGSWPLFWGFLIGAILTAVYSLNLPLLRWKNSALLAATNIFANAGVVRPLGYYLHMQTCVFKRPATFPRPLIFCTAILSLYFLVVALSKDIPDTEGDEKFGVQSLSVRLGQKKVFWICISLLQMGYGATILAGATSPFLWSKLSTGLGHGILALALWYRAKSVDLKSKDSFQYFYVFIWKLLSIEYFLIPLFR
ncbi:PREDICTED: naringenin 8-dimethylallyltransferase 2, chloroplastic-like isoform X2 [Lupinus angustifolius]|uniref:naringenin 8-dimethylallyltransferase 2, chloroplastic-like isoform X2 n=1 Tax=Lupinus angustifolius TaxID=3871 RepID=UPI00092ECC05|nr:PREDICTED: naringenin 8-dimethylallyltransferase 2, chloroplastic-like isoform X2 [Lupinus angustifolius]